MYVFVVVLSTPPDVRTTLPCFWTFHPHHKLVHRCKRLWNTTCSLMFGNSSVAGVVASIAKWWQHSLNCQGEVPCSHVFQLSSVYVPVKLNILLRYVCRFLLVQVKRYAVQMAIPEKLTSLVRVPISLSVKNCVSDDVIMPASWLPER